MYSYINGFTILVIVLGCEGLNYCSPTWRLRNGLCCNYWNWKIWEYYDFINGYVSCVWGWIFYYKVDWIFYYAFILFHCVACGNENCLDKNRSEHGFFRTFFMNIWLDYRYIMALMFLVSALLYWLTVLLLLGNILPFWMIWTNNV